MRTLKISQFQFHSRIVNNIRQGRVISRGALADLMKTSASTMGQHVDDLISRGFMEESGLGKGPKGRPKRLMRLLPEAGWFAGVEFTGGRLQAVRLNFAGEREHEISEPLPNSIAATEVLGRIGGAIHRMREGACGPLLGIGVGAPGFVDSSRGTVVYSQFQPDWQNVPLVEELGRHFGVPISVENNLHVIAMAERWFGAGREEDDFVIVRARIGFGLAVVKDGRLMSGAHHGAGEIGLWPWPLEGGSGQVHEALSARAVWRKLSGVKKRTAAPEDLVADLSKVADATGSAWDEVVTSYARVLGIAQLLIDSRLYFLHGPLTALGQRFCDEVNLRCIQLIPALGQSPVKLIPTTISEVAGALGAASLAMEAWDPQLIE